jgi:Family of unknown function (DUF5317)
LHDEITIREVCRDDRYRCAVFLLLATLLPATIIIVVTRGSLFQLTRLKVDCIWLLGSGLVIQIALEIVTFPKAQIDTVGFGLLMASYVLILTFCLLNFSVKGFGVIAIGIAMNTLVIGLNRSMPTIPVGSDAHGNRIEKPIELTVKHRQERRGDLLKVLDDRIVLPRPFDTVVSFGDLVMAAGICELSYYASRRRYTRRGLVTQESGSSTPRRRSTRSSAPSTRPS